jgi:hypothetical protein
MRRAELTGQKFGRLTALDETLYRDIQNRRLWRCLCECGRHTVTKANSLLTGKTKSCGCLRNDLARARGNSNHFKWKTMLKDCVISLERMRKENRGYMEPCEAEQAARKYLGMT